MLNSDNSLDLFRKRGAALLQFSGRDKVQKAGRLKCVRWLWVLWGLALCPQVCSFAIHHYHLLLLMLLYLSQYFELLENTFQCCNGKKSPPGLATGEGGRRQRSRGAPGAELLGPGADWEEGGQRRQRSNGFRIFLCTCGTADSFLYQLLVQNLLQQRITSCLLKKCGLQIREAQELLAHRATGFTQFTHVYSLSLRF